MADLTTRQARSLALVQDRHQRGQLTTSADLAAALNLQGVNALKIARRTLDQLVAKKLLQRAQAPMGTTSLVWLPAAAQAPPAASLHRPESKATANLRAGPVRTGDRLQRRQGALQVGEAVLLRRGDTWLPGWWVSAITHIEGAGLALALQDARENTTTVMADRVRRPC